jgi:4'-phosphopantetheinyl transferase
VVVLNSDWIDAVRRTGTAVKRGEVHIWIAQAAASQRAASELEETLSPEEHAAASRFRFQEHRLNYVFAHGVLRDILSRYLAREPSDIRLEADTFGKPFLSDSDARKFLTFNMSHSSEVVVVALACGRQIGVDVEKMRPLNDLAGIAESNFTPQERAFLSHHRPENQGCAFFRCWVRKEAYIKAVGRGLSIPLNTFDTSIPEGQAGRLLPHTADAPEAKRWWLADLDVPAGYSGAVAVEDGFDRLSYHTWSTRETDWPHRS